MMNGAEGQASEQPDDEAPPAPTGPTYRPAAERSIPKLDRGLVWSDLVREMEEEHTARLARRAAEKVVPMRPGRAESGDPAKGIEEAA